MSAPATRQSQPAEAARAPGVRPELADADVTRDTEAVPAPGVRPELSDADVTRNTEAARAPRVRPELADADVTRDAQASPPSVTKPELTDAEFLAAVESATYPGADFRHRAHVRLAWLCLREHGFEFGLERVRGRIQRYAAALGATGKYHETLTRAWAELVWVGLEAAPDAASFDAFLEARPELCDSRLLERHYRKETLDSPAAREGWVPPDKAPLR